MPLTSTRPLVVDIKRHSLEDGPGIRSVVFFKGCPLRCIFCQNPEAQEPGAEIAFFARKCFFCGKCEKVCLQGAIELDSPGRINREKCIRCGQCAHACPDGALKLVGHYYAVERLSEILLRDLPYYRHSGGGVTLSGGECTLYPDYLEALLQSLKTRNVHLVLETSGYFDYDTFTKKILPHIDLIYYDIKIAEPLSHAEYTGQSNHRIIKNFCRLIVDKNVEVHPRIPLVPGITATRDNLTSIVNFLWEAKAANITLLPYNPLGIEMAVNLGRPKPSVSGEFMKPEEEKRVCEMFDAIIQERPKSRLTVRSSLPA